MNTLLKLGALVVMLVIMSVVPASAQDPNAAPRIGVYADFNERFDIYEYGSVGKVLGAAAWGVREEPDAVSFPLQDGSLNAAVEDILIRLITVQTAQRLDIPQTRPVLSYGARDLGLERVVAVARAAGFDRVVIAAPLRHIGSGAADLDLAGGFGLLRERAFVVKNAVPYAQFVLMIVDVQDAKVIRRYDLTIPDYVLAKKLSVKWLADMRDYDDPTRLKIEQGLKQTLDKEIARVIKRAGLSAKK